MRAALRFLSVCLAAFLAVTSSVGAEVDPAHEFGSAWNPALGAWLPKVGLGFDYSRRGLAALSSGHDYFVCTTGALPAINPQDFRYASRGCPALSKGTSVIYGSAGPSKGHILYDAAHGIALYEAGCCAERNTVLVAGVAKPPKPVAGATLSNVHTARGVRLGMTSEQVTKLYGPAKLHTVAGTPGVMMLSYTMLRGGFSNPNNTCGQFQNFAFRNGRLYYIELLAGC